MGKCGSEKIERSYICYICINIIDYVKEKVLYWKIYFKYKCHASCSCPSPLLLLTRALSLALNLSSSTACLACVGVGLTIHSTHRLVHLHTCTTWDGCVGGAGWWICNYKVNKGKNVQCTHLSYKQCQYGTLSTSHHHTPAGT